MTLNTHTPTHACGYGMQVVVLKPGYLILLAKKDVKYFTRKCVVTCLKFIGILYKFTSKSYCKTILKISQHLVKSQARVMWHLPASVSNCPVFHDPMCSNVAPSCLSDQLPSLSRPAVRQRVTFLPQCPTAQSFMSDPLCSNVAPSCLSDQLPSLSWPTVQQCGIFLPQWPTAQSFTTRCVAMWHLPASVTNCPVFHDPLCGNAHKLNDNEKQNTYVENVGLLWLVVCC